MEVLPSKDRPQSVRPLSSPSGVARWRVSRAGFPPCLPIFSTTLKVSVASVTISLLHSGRGRPKNERRRTPLSSNKVCAVPTVNQSVEGEDWLSIALRSSSALSAAACASVLVIMRPPLSPVAPHHFHAMGSGKAPCESPQAAPAESALESCVTPPRHRQEVRLPLTSHRGALVRCVP